MLVEGQQLLRDSSLLVIGAGALASPVLLYCAGAGIASVCLFFRIVYKNQSVNFCIRFSVVNASEFRHYFGDNEKISD